MKIKSTNDKEIIKEIKPQVPKLYVKVPKQIILENSLTEHRISVLCYLNYNQTWEKTIGYSPIHMIQWSGYKANWRKLPNGNKNIYDKFLDCMNWYFENGYIIDFDSKKYIRNTFQSSLLNADIIFPKNNFGLIYDFEIKAITNYKSSYTSLNKSILLLVLSYIRAFTWIRSNEVSGHSEKSKRNKPEIFYSHFKTIGENLGINPKLVSRATDILRDLGILKVYEMPTYQDENKYWHNGETIFICPYKISSYKGNLRVSSKDEYNWEKELEYGIKYLKELKHFSKKFYQD